MTAPRSVKVGRVVLLPCKRNGYYLVDGDERNHVIGVCKTVYGDYRAWHRTSGLDANALSLEAAADALTAKLKQLRAALADVLGEEEGT